MYDKFVVVKKSVYTIWLMGWTVCLGEKTDIYGNGKKHLFCWITAHILTKCCICL